MAAAGIASRRACEELIAAGEVEVNDEPVLTLPVWVDPQRDTIRVSGRPLPKPERNVYLMMHKPRHTLCTVDDPGGRKTVLDLIEYPGDPRLYPVGRLDYDTMGLLLLTNDGELANRLTHPRYEQHKTYRAVVKGRLEEEAAQKLAKGVFLADRKEGTTIGGSRTSGVRIEIVHREPTRTHLDITLREGRNRQVRRMLAAVGCDVKKLTRIRMGPLELKGVALGSWRELTRQEIGALRRAAFGASRKTRSSKRRSGAGGRGR